MQQDDMNFEFKGAMLAECDLPRLNTNARRIWGIMIDGYYEDLNDISKELNIPHSSVTACVRAFRYDKNGGHIVKSMRAEDEKGTWLYKLEPASREACRAAKERASVAKRKPSKAFTAGRTDMAVELLQWLEETCKRDAWFMTPSVAEIRQKIEDEVKKDV